jgi:hypothetical protein
MPSYSICFISDNMYSSLIILVLLVNGGLTIDCPSSPSKWCESKEIAQACDVCKRRSHCSVMIYSFR